MLPVRSFPLACDEQGPVTLTLKASPPTHCKLRLASKYPAHPALSFLSGFFESRGSSNV